MTRVALPLAPDLVGRAPLLADLVARLGGGARLVTLEGPGGVGKTSLALALARAIGATAFVDLASVSNADDLAIAVAAALGAPVPDASARRPALLARAALDRAITTLVLDNAETALDAVRDFVRAVADDAAVLGLVVTSRERLALSFEHVVVVDPLSPADARRLFERRMLQSGRAVREGDDEAIGELVRRLDGVPLALEIAAARTLVLAPRALVAELDRVGPLALASPFVDATPRHRSLHALLESSWAALDDAGRRALARLGAFASAFDDDAARALLGPTAVEDLFTLGKRSWVTDAARVGRGEGNVLLEMVRLFALEKLRARGDEAEVFELHAVHVVARAERAFERAKTSAVRAALGELAAMRPELLVVLARAHEGSIPRAASRACAVTALLELVDELTVPRDVLVERADRALASKDGSDASEPTWRARVLEGKARALGRLNRMQEAKVAVEEAIDAAIAAGDTETEATARRTAAMMALVQGDLERALREARLGDDAALRGRHAWARAAIASTLGMIAVARGDALAALEDLERAATLARASGNVMIEVYIELWRTEIFAARGALEDARAAAARCAMAVEASPEGRPRTVIHEALAQLAIAEHDYARAAVEAERHVRATEQLGDRSTAVAVRRFGAACRLAAGDREAARAALQASSEEDPLLRAGDLARAWLAALDATEGHLDRAAATFESLRTRVVGGRHEALVRTLEARLDLVRGDVERAKSAAARARAELASCVASGELLLACLLLEAAIADEEALTIDPTGAWFAWPRQERVPVTQAPLQRLLVRLVEEHRRARGRPISREELIRVGWPGERIQPTAAKNRLFTAISTLRRAGLGKALATEEDGYLLAEETRVR